MRKKRENTDRKNRTNEFHEFCHDGSERG